MKIEIDTIEIGAGNLKLAPPVQGIFIPPVRTSSGNFSGKDGGWVSSQFYAPREIVINGTAIGYSCAEAFEVYCEMLSALSIRQSHAVTITTPDGTKYYTDAYFLDLNMDYDLPKITPFQITLVAPDPYFYGGGSGSLDPEGWIEQTIYKIVGGGYVTPYILPVIWEAGTTPAIVNNPGDIWLYPQIILEDQWTNPVVTNTTTGQYIELNITTTDGDIIVIDMENRTITLNGGSILPLRVEGSSWWPIVPGDNYVSIESDSSEDAEEGTVRYRVKYTGVFGGLC